MSNPNDVKFYKLKEFLDEKTFPTPKPIIHDFIHDNELVILSAKAKTGKSMLALDMALAVSRGEIFLGKFQTERRSVVLFQTEIANPMLRRRLLQMRANPDNEMLSITDERVRIDISQGYHTLQETIKRQEPCLIILDPFYTMHNGDENQSSSMAPILFRLKDLTKRYQCSILLIHHQGKQGELSSNTQAGHKHRGSSSFADVPDMSISLTKQSGDKLMLSFECRNIETPNDLEIYRNDNLRHETIGESINNREQWLLDLIKSSGGMLKQELIQKSNQQFRISDRTSEKIISNLTHQKKIDRKYENSKVKYFALPQDRSPL